MIKIDIPTIEKQHEFIEIMKNTHNHNIDMSDCNTIPSSWKKFDEGYIAPTADEIRLTFKDYSNNQLATMLGLLDAGRIIRRWKSGEKKIPYAAWRLFLILTERVIL